MFSATSHRRLGASSLRTALFLARRCRGHLVQRDTLLLDTRYWASSDLIAPVASLLVVSTGAMAVAGQPARFGRQAYVAAQAEFERRQPGALTFRSWGAPCQILELRVALDELRVPVGLHHGPIELPPSVWTALDAAFEALRQPQVDEATLGFPDIVRALGDAGVVARDLADSVTGPEPEAFARLWAGLRPLYARLDTSPSLGDVQAATGLSLRQLSRDVKDFTRAFGLFGEGFREATRVLRLRAACLFLSSPGATASEVSRQVGYTSLDAMGRAFRDAGLPAPSVIQEQVRFSATLTP